LTPKKSDACGSLALSADKHCLLWGCGNKNIFDFQWYSRFTCASLGGRVPLSAQKKEQFIRLLFFCAVPAPILIFPPTSL
jgi:hypothetical protein